jgi:hypothetical protein
MRERYEHVRMLEELRDAHSDPKTIAFANDLIAEEKKTIRRILRTSSPKEECHMVYDNGIDGACLRIKITGVYSKEAAELKFLSEYYLEPIASAFDCTGRLFTSWYKIVQMHGDWYAYHSICRDC